MSEIKTVVEILSERQKDLNSMIARAKGVISDYQSKLITFEAEADAINTVVSLMGIDMVKEAHELPPVAEEPPTKTKTKTKKTKIVTKRPRGKKRSASEASKLTEAILRLVQEKAPKESMALSVRQIAEAIYRDYSKETEDIVKFRAMLSTKLFSMLTIHKGLKRFAATSPKARKPFYKYYWKN